MNRRTTDVSEKKEMKEAFKKPLRLGVFVAKKNK
jgi:hypothetical protein